MRRRFTVIVGLAFIPVLALAQQRDVIPSSAGTGEINGVVWSPGASPQPVRRVVVTLAGGEVAARSVITDDTGQFAFGKLPAGSYSVTAKKAAYLATEFGSPKPGRPGTRIALASGEKRAIGLTIYKGGAISGVLRDESGRPVAGASVAAIDVRATRDPAAIVSPETVGTDDRGEFRIFGLMPGDYAIVASALPTDSGDIALRRTSEMDAVLSSLNQRQNRTPLAGTSPAAPTVAGAATPTPTPIPKPALVGYAPIYYPGTPFFPESARIHVESGDERGGVSFTVSHVPVTTVEGVITGAVPNLASVQLAITPDGPKFNISTGGITATPPDASGVFKYGNLPPGKYRIVARARSGPPDPNASAGAGRGRAGLVGGGAPPPGVIAPSGDMLYAVADVEVRGQNVTGVNLALQPGGTITGKIVFDAVKSAYPDEWSTIRVSVSQIGGSWSAQSGNVRVGPAISSIPPVTVKDDGTFEIKGIGPSLYTVTCLLPTEHASYWKLRSAVIDGRDLLDTLLEGPGGLIQGLTLTLSDKHTQIAGTVRSAAGQPVSEYSVVAFSADRANWRIGSRRNLAVRTSTDGRFELADLPAGDYFVAVVNDLDPLEWQLPDSLEQLAPGAVRVRLTEGGKVTQDLQIR